MFGQVYQRAHEFDIIHCHTDYLSLPLARFTPTPTVVTLHGRLDIPELAPLYHEYLDVPLVSISDAQRDPLPGVNWAATVYHGLPFDLYPSFQPHPGSYLLFLGRIAPEKRPDSAIRVACQAKIPLRIAAKVDQADREYFETTIRPLLNHPLIDFLGEVNDAQKRELLSNALALLFPIDWPEPFGLVMIEALACGTPVITRRRGSTPEIIRDGQTGFICETEEEMREAVRRIGELDRAECRREFLARFTAAHMVQRYLQVYQMICTQRRPAIAHAPAVSFSPSVVAPLVPSFPGESAPFPGDRGREKNESFPRA
jgi:glycosyltransferase involved in cell wall biosynthesis